METTTSLTDYQRASILDAIESGDKYIATESKRNAALRPAKTAELLAWYINHRVKLLAMLAA